MAEADPLPASRVRRTRPPLVTTAYARVMVIDSNVVLETQPLDKLPWSELGQGPILLLVSPQASGEIDGKKQDSRLGPRARDFAKRLDAALEAGVPVRLTDGPPVVDLDLLTPDRIVWEDVDLLDPQNGDDRIVAETLHALVDAPGRLEVMSFDVRPRHKASIYGLAGYKPSGTWLHSVGPSKKDGRLAELEAELAILRKSQPEVSVNITATDGPLYRLKVTAPAPDQLDQLAATIMSRHPVPTEPALRMLEDILNRVDREADARWRRDVVHRHLPNAHRGLERLFGQHHLEIEIENGGALAAEELHVTATSNTANLHSRPYEVEVLGGPHPDHRQRRSYIDAITFRPDRFDFEPIDEGPGPAISWRCADFRPGRRHVLHLFADISRHRSAKLNVEVSLTCANSKGRRQVRLVEVIQERRASFGDMVDGSRAVIIGPHPVAAAKAVWDGPEPDVFRNDGSLVDD